MIFFCMTWKNKKDEEATMIVYLIGSINENNKWISIAIQGLVNQVEFFKNAGFPYEHENAYFKSRKCIYHIYTTHFE